MNANVEKAYEWFRFRGHGTVTVGDMERLAADGLLVTPEMTACVEACKGFADHYGGSAYLSDQSRAVRDVDRLTERERLLGQSAADLTEQCERQAQEIAELRAALEHHCGVEWNEGRVVHVHSADCPGFCDFACGNERTEALLMELLAREVK